MQQAKMQEDETKQNAMEEPSLSDKTLYVYPTSERLHEEHLKEIFTLFGSIEKLIHVKEKVYNICYVVLY